MPQCIELPSFTSDILRKIKTLPPPPQRGWAGPAQCELHCQCLDHGTTLWPVPEPGGMRLTDSSIAEQDFRRKHNIYFKAHCPSWGGRQGGVVPKSSSHLCVYWNAADVRTRATGSSAKWVMIQDLAKVTKLKSKSRHKIILLYIHFPYRQMHQFWACLPHCHLSHFRVLEKP